MAELFTLPKQVPIQSSGAPWAGAKAYFYRAGTTTDQAVYTDAACSVAHAQPVVADANGVFAPIYKNPNASHDYRLQLKQSDGTLIYDVDNIPRFTLTQAQIGALFYPRTAAEIAAGVTPTDYAYPPLDIRRYGGDPTGGGNSDTALASAISVCGTNGGVIVAPSGAYVFASAISLNVKRGIIIQGEGSQTSGGQPATRFTYSGTGTGVWINMDSSEGCSFRNLQLFHSNSGFTGTYIRSNNDGTNGDPAFNSLVDCTLGNLTSSITHLNLNKCIEFTCERCTFVSGNPSVVGMQAGGYSNVIRFRDCEWPDSASASAPISGGGQAWTISGCAFGNLSTGAPGAIVNASNTPLNGLTISGCWFGDAGTTAGAWLDIYGQALHFCGNYVGGNTTGSTAIKLRQFHGANITGNTFDQFLNGIDFATATCAQITVKDNVFNGVTNPWANTTNISGGQLDWGVNYQGGVPSGHGSLGTNGYEFTPRGTCKQWGKVTVTTGTPAAVTFPITFPAAVTSIVITMEGPTATTNTCYISSSPTTSGFSANVAGTAGSQTVHWQAVGY